MKLEDQVCTLEQSKKLHELGIEPNSYFAWIKGKDEKENVVAMKLAKIAKVKIPESIGEIYPAFTVSELGVMINWFFVEVSAPWGFNYDWILSTNYLDKKHENEAIVRADMLIHLLETKLSTPQECNQRLIQ